MAATTKPCNECKYMVTRPDGVHLCLRNVVQQQNANGEQTPCFLSVEPTETCDKFKAIGTA